MPEVRKVFTLAAGNNRLSTLLASVSSSIQMQLTHLTVENIGPGIVAKGDSAMAAVADGQPLAVNEVSPEDAYGTDRIDATQVYFRPTTGGTDKIYIEARSA